MSASLSNAYLPSECSTSIGGEPQPDETNAIRIKPSSLKREKVTLRFQGATSRESTEYRWSTVIVLRHK